MGRRRVFANAAERQKAHRQRQSGTVSVTASLEPRRRPLSRPARVAALVDGAQALLDEYRDWLERLPETFESTAMHERLMDSVERLDTAVEALEGMDPPLGFGRD